jgi:hypothetical protein
MQEGNDLDLPNTPPDVKETTNLQINVDPYFLL